MLGKMHKNSRIQVNSILVIGCFALHAGIQVSIWTTEQFEYIKSQKDFNLQNNISVV